MQPLGLRDIAAEGVLLLGGARAILLQLAHPSVGRGVAEHSDFTADPLGRFRSTVTFAYTVVFGSAAEVTTVRRHVNRAHAPVRGDLTPREAAPDRGAASSAVAYNAFDAGQQLWVAATLYETTVAVYERVFGPLDHESADRLLRESAILGITLQMPEELWPADLASFAGYWEVSLNGLQVTETTRRIARQLLYPTNVPPWVRLAMPLVRLVTVGLLPGPVRAAYRFRWSAAHDRGFALVMRTIAALYPRLPGRVRLAPRDYYLAELRRSMR